ncbi:serine hydrolase domain-containing protein [Pseudaminobacter soli (ex Li et al. 2025)]|uniref:6-aminohexanoate hydrolase n=1 Tax=Pseudaminobacter soli (ex Li et al. 2025) TaxID=1295366 RepID=A0A2P7SMD0_9HYPH|nr:serine hydrolase [Mesorhizobium soli]PSJ63597.1 6-aminohexanoate hydrolase [Mesorhizobium soli]
MTAQTAFARQFGFARSDVTIENWRTAPYNRWSFQNVGELVPTSEIAAPTDAPEAPAGDLGALLDETVATDAGSESIAAFLERTHTDAFVALKGGKVVGEYNAPHMTPGGRHIIFSISKSLTAILAGALQADDLLDPAAPVTKYIPEAAGTAFADATVQHVLDMTTTIDFEELYLDPESAFARYRRSTLWNPNTNGADSEKLLAFLMTIGKGAGEHGEVFRYRSPNSDLLGIIVERASGLRYADLMVERLWGPLGARRGGRITVDGQGSGRAAGGISVTARDLARVGEMMRNGGVHEGRRILPEGWVKDTATGGDREAWKKGDFAFLMPNGSYRNKWYQTGFEGEPYCGIGIHGQWLYVDPANEAVLVKMSSQPLPVDDELDKQNLVLFQTVAKLL